MWRAIPCENQTIQNNKEKDINSKEINRMALDNLFQAVMNMPVGKKEKNDKRKKNICFK